MKLPAPSIKLPKSSAGTYPSLEAVMAEARRPAREVAGPKRRRIWELSNNFHCSVIGTCLSTQELRHILLKIDLPGASKETDHLLHGRAVLLASQRDAGARLLQKALDRRHRSAIQQFDKARNAEDLHTLWNGAVQRAEIPGAYWAILTHPLTTEDLVREVFGEVHMLSHLVGAANRADIRRLRELEAENAELQETVTRQQKHLRDVVVQRNATVAALNEMLAKAIAAKQQPGAEAEPAGEAEQAAATRLIADLQRRLGLEVANRERADLRLQAVTCERDAERKQRQALERHAQELRGEVEAAERSLADLFAATTAGEEPPVQLSGATLLYVGGREHHIPQLRKLAERWNAALLHHDGGISDRSGLLEAQVARADLTLFPVDCVSHNAVAIVKRVSRSIGKSYIALRSSGLTSFAAALRTVVAQQPTGSSWTAAQAETTI